MITLYSKLRMDMTGNLALRARTAGQALYSMAARGKQSLTTLSKSAQAVDAGMEKLWNRYTALSAGVGVTMAMRNTADLELRLTRLGIQAEISQKQVNGLNNEIYRISQLRDININPDELLSAVEKIVSKTGNLEFAQENLKNLAYTISATGAAGNDVGAMAADLFEKFNIKDANQMIATLGMLVNQGKAGAFELRDLATQGERVTAAYGQMGRTGVEAAAEMGAMLQMARKATGSPEQAATALEAFIRNLNAVEKRSILQKSGIRLMDPEDPKRMRSAIEIAKDLIKLTKGDVSKIGRVIDAEGISALNAMIIEYKQTNAFETVDSFVKISRESKGLLADSARVAGTLDSSLTSLKTAWSGFANRNLAVPVQRLADALNRIQPEQLDKWLQTAGKIAVTVGSTLLAYKTAKGVYGVYSFLKKPVTAIKGGKDVSPLGGFSMASPLPVYVVNNMGGVGDLLGVGGKKGRGAVRALGKYGKFGKYAGAAMRFGGKALGVAGLGFAAYDALNAENKAALSGSIGSIAGGLIGTIGGPLGMMAGSVIGNFLGEKIGSLFDEMPQTSQKIVKSEQNNQVAKTQTEIKLEVTSPNAAVNLTSMKENSTPLNQCKLDLSLGGRM